MRTCKDICELWGSNMKGRFRFKKAQEEMVGFALIMIVVAVILLVFLGFYLRKSGTVEVESYEVESFIQSFLQYTSDCRDNLEYRSVKNLIFDCSERNRCLDGRESCEVLKSDLEGMIQEGWRIENLPIAGYELKILEGEQELLVINGGNSTKNSRGAAQYFNRGGSSFEIFFNAYS